MVHQRREQCESEIYHIVVRGVGRQLIFEDDQDNYKFLTTLFEQATVKGVELYAWCLMGNHAHMLMHGPLEAISSLMQMVNRMYASYFNARHDRVGHLMQGRFRSVPVKDDAQLSTVVMYIHLNPVEAGITVDCRYAWSSYSRYFDPTLPVGMQRVLDIFGGASAFADAHCAVEGGPLEDLSAPKNPRMSDSHAKEVLQDVLSGQGRQEVPTDDKTKRDNVLAELRRRGLSIRQIERLTGIGRNIVAKAK